MPKNALKDTRTTQLKIELESENGYTKAPGSFHLIISKVRRLKGFSEQET